MVDGQEDTSLREGSEGTSGPTPKRGNLALASTHKSDEPSEIVCFLPGALFSISGLCSPAT